MFVWTVGFAAFLEIRDPFLGVALGRRSVSRQLSVVLASDSPFHRGVVDSVVGPNVEDVPWGRTSAHCLLAGFSELGLSGTAASGPSILVSTCPAAMGLMSPSRLAGFGRWSDDGFVLGHFSSSRSRMISSASRSLP